MTPKDLLSGKTLPFEEEDKADLPVISGGLLAPASLEDLYKTIFETTGAATIIIEEDMSISMANRECKNLLGYSREEISGGKKWDDFIASDELERLREYHRLRRMNPDAVPKTYETRLIDRRGNIKNVSITADLIPGTKKSIVSILDLTGYKKAEEALRESEEKYRTLVENVNIGVYRNTGGPHGRFLQANPAIVKMFGYESGEEFLTVHISELYQNQEDRKKFVEKIRKQGYVKDEQLRLQKKDGTSIWGSVTAKVQYGAHGEIRWIDGVIEDVTERKRAEEKLMHSLEALQSVYRIATTLSGSYEGVCDQVVLALSKLLGIPHVAVKHVEEEGRVKIISAITDGYLSNVMLLPEHSPCAGVVCGKNETCQIHGRHEEIHRGNEVISTFKFKSYIGVPIRSIRGKTVGAICAMDYEERTFREDEVHLIEIFASYVAHELERNSMEAQLRHLDRMKLLGQIAAGVAHEVRNPLNAILAITEALFQDIGDNPEYKPFLYHIRRQVDRLSRLMGDLLDLGKPIQQSCLCRGSLPAICAVSIDLWEQTTLSRTHKARLILPPEKGNLYIMADGSQLQQVFLNLLENAAQHSPEGSEIQFALSVPEKGTVRIRIIDRGTGICHENLQKVFEPFFTTREKGNGLGLSIVKNTVQALGGDIVIRNNDPPPGCNVEITLPVAGEDET